MAYAYPLRWPVGWERSAKRVQSKFNTPLGKAMNSLTAEVGRVLGASHLVICSDLPLKADATPRMDRDPVDPGVAVYFQRNGSPVVFACDQYDVVRDNVLAIAKTIEALRGIERWGASDAMERAFRGFAALHEPERVTPWNEILGFNALQVPALDSDLIEMRYKRLAQERHPDRGGDEKSMQELNRARAEGLKVVSAQAIA
jgi:hypothetical protein